MPLNVNVSKLFLPTGLTTPITATLYYKPYYATSWTLIEANVPIQLDGTITASPPPHFSVNPMQPYMLRAVNDMCGFDYQQPFIINPFCPPGYTISADDTYCFYQLFAPATAPSNPLNTVAQTHSDYSVWGSLIFDPGFNSNGVGTFTQISYGNTFWVNGAGYPSGSGANTALGPLNRSGLWASSTTDNQDIGFAVCINAPAAGTYYVGVGSDNYATIKVNGNIILQQDPTALGAYLASHGYLGVGVESTFRFWCIYPISLPVGESILEIVAHNVSLVAALGAEVYNNTPSQIQAATNYSGLNLIFSTKDYIGMPVQLGSAGIGYSCPAGYALQYCSSPIVCVKTVTTPVLY